MAHQVGDGGGRVVDQVNRGGTQLGGIVRRDRGRHADGDAAGTVGEQVRESARQDNGLLVLLVIGEAEIDGGPR